MNEQTNDEINISKKGWIIISSITIIIAIAYFISQYNPNSCVPGTNTTITLPCYSISLLESNSSPLKLGKSAIDHIAIEKPTYLCYSKEDGHLFPINANATKDIINANITRTCVG